MPTTVRPATSDDAAACAEIVAPYVADSWESFETTPPDKEEMLRRIGLFAGRGTFQVVEEAGHVVGFAYARPYADRAAFRWTIETNVYIESQHTRRGHGRMLYGALIPRLRERGYRRVVASIVLPNDRAIRLHRGLGFREAGHLEKIGWKAGAWRDAALMQLDLDR